MIHAARLQLVPAPLTMAGKMSAGFNGRALAVIGGGRRRARQLALLLLIALPACDTARAMPSDLAAFLQRTERMAAYPQPLRVDILIERDGGGEQALVIVDPASRLAFFAMRGNGWRGLMPLAWGHGKAVRATGKPTASWNVDTPLPGTELRPMEFFPFWRSDYERAFISDENRLEKTVTFYSSDDSPYSLLVVTFDKTKLVPMVAKYYQETMNNLARIRYSRDYVMVGSRPRPQRLELQDFIEARKTKLRLRWTVLEKVPGPLLDEKGFAEAPIDWPAP